MTAKKQTKPAAEAGTLVYCGPTIPGVAKQFTSYRGGIPEALAAAQKKAPVLGGLIVPLDQLPEAMRPYVARMDFIIGVQARAPHNCGVITWNGTAYINCIRNIREPELELHFYQVLHELGLPVKAESNQR